ncbi:MAG: magnesium transporter CorA family protein [Rhizobiaceae bacterium]
MITIHLHGKTCFEGTQMKAGDTLPAQTVWIDLYNPTVEEDRQVETLLGIGIPTREDMKEIEESSRVYTEDGAHYLTAPLVHAGHSEKPGLSPVTFILAAGRLITVRYSDPTSFRKFRTRIEKSGSEFGGKGTDGILLLAGLLESVIDRLADLLEDVTGQLDAEADRLFADAKTPMSTPQFRSAMRLLGTEGAFLSKVGESLQGLSRVVSYLHGQNTGAKASANLREKLSVLDRDMLSLKQHADFLSNKITMLLDTVVGLVSVEQNAIIKIFSVAAVGFMPPTLVASIYGMNFDFMPELAWAQGYPFALLLMALSAVLPLVFFRFKGWL